MLKNYVIVMIALGLFSAMAGGMRSRSTPSPTPAIDRFAESSSIARASTEHGESARSTNGGELVLDRHDDGHFYADVEVNGVTVPMMVDTGASDVALSADDARRAGIATSIGMHDVIGEGADGAVHGDVVTIDRISLGDVEQAHVLAAVLGGGSTSLLGQSFLKDFRSVEISGDQMHLR